MTSRQFRTAAALVAIAYIAIQGFQEYVYRSLGDAATPAASLALGSHPLHIARSIAMLAAIFGLVFLYGAICLQRVRERPVLAGFTFLAFLLFGLLEIGLRSVELIWTQLELPAAYARAPDPAILAQVASFEAVQHALYLPLGFAVLLGSALGIWLFATARPFDPGCVPVPRRAQRDAHAHQLRRRAAVPGRRVRGRVLPDGRRVLRPGRVLVRQATVISVLTELAMKQPSCAAWCSWPSCSAVGCRSPA